MISRSYISLAYKPKRADTFSQMPQKVELLSLIAPPLIDVDIIQQEVIKDEELKKIREQLETDLGGFLSTLLTKVVL